ncbi:uncharacterized protein EV420DRAFT_1584419 [Desarmillaria tabescens]|uniref:F-box domain-containing protein n=1 Tax=Armillaria tabescens TaxID=1929756 RepID=A0AA39JAZ2_ARMTA|nr:uncharacterized protein EV420DRAFT_1584419 [Desarmillaria tabescens]KAK0439298.1 hypothetical protein EV420DRAFT_1584419 [Desarmillaria tabescens]
MALFTRRYDFNAAPTCPTCGSVNKTPSKPFAAHTRSPRVSELLRCNDIPSETELSEFQDVIMHGPGRLADIDKRIERSRNLIDMLMRERHSLESDMEDAKILSSPVRRLPPDILHSICLETIPSSLDIMSPNFEFSDSLNTRSSPWTISQVCRRWRSTVVNSPELWSSTSLVNATQSLLMTASGLIKPRSNLQSMFLLGIRLQRSQSFPLTLSLWSASDVSQHPFLALISIHAYALQNLRIHVPVRSLVAFSGCRGRLERLEHLILESNDESLPEGWAINVFEYAPRLRILIAPIHHFPRAVEIPWFQLCHCTLQIDDEHDLPLLELLDNVKSADICSGGNLLRVPQGHKPIHLPRLTSLALTSQNPVATPSPDLRVIFSSLSLPNLVDLHITYFAMPVLPHISIQPNVITRLELTRISSTAGGIPSSENMPLRHLRVLDLSGCELDCDYSSFVKMVEARRQGDHSKCDQLETLYLATPLELGGPTAEIWSNLLEGGLNVMYGAQNVAD